MRTFQVRAGGGLITSAERPVPSPSAGEVLVRVKASSLNARDLLIVTGRYSVDVPPGRIPLSDGAGVVEAVGDGVSRFRVGDRVAGTFHPTWLYGPFPEWGQLRGTHRDGWLTEYIALDEQSAVAVPDHLTFEEAATLPCAALTAWSAVSGVGPGNALLVQGSGGVSVFALQLARLAGARVLATTSSDDKARRLSALGASDVVDYTSTPEWGARVRALTGGGADRVVEIGGAGTLSQSIDAVAHGGQIALVGNLAAGDGMDVNRFFRRAATLRSISVGSRGDFERMNKVIAQNRLRPVIDRVFPFDQAPEAFSHFEKGPRFGKVVISH
ncbi:zinc-binding dehydrogenase [Streptomyces sp. SID8361]|uniref:zinc-dependent alcohol dehydrogenase family protein n=1 Tax=Streptomyces sp. MnatMP-M27 TaxID=1839768 RepID=UPI00081F40AD|nr:NAD(P)-dependent alcohol dehydrogenase [Streptomyces sp. MnatMP-M27]MYU16002.1 zinc-binding dehydrogenase [Streptomyces sp. SID8361]SCG10550.1 NADPH:quinone reductase [Streptomyces sp. MnatMP-M27]